MMKLLNTIVILQITIVSIAYSQNNPLDNITLPTPQAASFMRYGDIPVSLATGIPSIDIPLYTVECDGYKLPISISYHASGIKVDDIASVVGLGWSLNAGGLVSRTIMGSYSEDYFIKDETEWNNRELNSLDRTDCKTISEMATGSLNFDTESDRYYYALGNQTGYFRENIKTRKYVLLPYKPLKITEIIPNTSRGYSICAADGTQYFFEKTGVSDGKITSWYLTKIVTPRTRRTITFTYQMNYYSQVFAHESFDMGTFYGKEILGMSQSPLWMSEDGYLYRFPIDYDLVEKNKLGLPLEHEVQLNNQRRQDHQMIMTSYAEPIISTIEWQNNKVQFHYLEDRKDSPNNSGKMKRLVKITVSNNMNSVIKTIAFEKTELGQNKDEYRTLLTAVNIGDEKYSFTYNMGKLPPYNNSQKGWQGVNCHSDFWGYYNGITSRYFCPLVKDKTWSRQNYCLNNNLGFNGKDKSPDADYAQHGILQSITYPTGGTTAFKYEGNEVSSSVFGGKWGGLRVKSIEKLIGDIVQNRIEYSYDKPNPPIVFDQDLFWSNKEYVHYLDNLGPDAHSAYYDDIHYHCESSSVLPISGWSTTPVFYDKVVSSVYDKNNNLIKTVEFHYSPDEYYTSMSGYPDDLDNNIFFSVYRLYDQGMVTPLLTYQKETTFTEGKESSRIMRNNYEQVSMEQQVVGVVVGHRSIWDIVNPMHDIEPPVPYMEYTLGNIPINYKTIINSEGKPVLKGEQDACNEFYKDFYFHNVYAIPSYRRLKSSTTLVDGMETTTSYTYDSEFRTLQPLSVTVENSVGDSKKTAYSYPFQETNDPVLVNMHKDNYVDVVVGTEEYVNDKIVSKSKDVYKQENGFYQLLEKQYALGSNPLETRFKVLAYDKNGNFQHVVQDNNYIVLVWNDQNQVVAQIDCGNNSKWFESNKSIIESIEKKGTVFTSGPYFRITNYKYKPLVGLCEVISGEGIKTSYVYDNMNRLSSIQDADNAVIEEYIYNYKH